MRRLLIATVLLTASSGMAVSASQSQADEVHQLCAIVTTSGPEPFENEHEPVCGPVWMPSECSDTNGGIPPSLLTYDVYVCVPS